MTKKSTKKVKAALKNMPKMKTSDDFVERLDEKIAELDRPECDQVDFDGGNVEIASGDDWSLHTTPAGWSIWLGILWIILSMPLWLGVWNSFNSDTNVIIDDTSLVPAPIEDMQVAPVILSPVDSTSTGVLEIIEDPIDDSSFIWEETNTFDEAFRLARMYLGPNEIFTWNGNDYHTLYIE